MHFTQNPIGSDDQLDLQDNAISFDYAMNSPAALWQDRFGKQHKTVQQALKDVGFKPAGFDFVSGGALGIGDRDKCVFYPTDGYWYSWNGTLPYVVPGNSSPTPGGKKGWGVVTRDERVIAREALSRTYLEAGLNLVEGSFEQGAVISSTTDVVLHEKTGKCYSGPVGEVPKGTNPLSGGFVDKSLSTLLEKIVSIDAASFLGSGDFTQIRTYTGSGNIINCIGEKHIFDGKFGVFKLNPDKTNPIDDGVLTLVDGLGRAWERVFKGNLSPRFAGVVGDGVVDDGESCNKLISVFKALGVPSPGGVNMNGRGIDWTGYICKISKTVDLTGLLNYVFTNPTFIGMGNFTGGSLLKIDSDHTYPVSMITWVNPQLDCAWNVDYCVEAYDFLKWSVLGGKLTHYKKKGFITGTIHDAAHEINMLGTFFFQREWNEVYPPSITEGEAWELNNYDNEFTNVIIGYHKQWAFTNKKGTNRFIGGHIYTGHNDSVNGGARSLGSDDDFVGTYFDYTWLQISGTRSSVSSCKFGINNGNIAIKLSLNPYNVKIVNNRLRKTGSGNARCIELPTIAEGRTSRPIIKENTFEGCEFLNTVGNLYQPIWNSVNTTTIPDEYRPLSSIGQIGKPSSAVGAFSDRFFGTEYNPDTNTLTIKCWKVDTNGSMIASSLDGKSCIIPLNL